MISVNNRTYQLSSRPVVGICLDGTAPDYLTAARDQMPRLAEIQRKGSFGLVHSAIPSFTNPNNIAMVTGVPSSQNGICGNFYYDREQDQEVMMNDPRYLCCPTILAAFSQTGHSVAAITAKDKLRRLLGENLQGICFSIENSADAKLEDGQLSVAEMMGRPAPGIYDPDISVYCIEAGLRLLQKQKVDLLYLSTTDFVQHKYKPGSPEANAFYAKVDVLLGELDRLGAVVGVTADHGMNDKVRQDGTPNVQFLETILLQNGLSDVRVILPITDPYVVHHGALGSYATIYLQPAQVDQATKILQGMEGIELVLPRGQAAARFHLPPDRIGELVVLADQTTVLGRRPEWHDLSVVQSGLRSHGGLHEQQVPFAINCRLKKDYRLRLESGEANNYDLFDFLFNGAEA
jgi:phosphonoacetate hydrolase